MGIEHELVVNFIHQAEQIIREKVDFLDPDEELTIHELFLRKLARRSVQKERLKIFTPNYDLCFEHAARCAGFIVIDGFTFTQPSFFDPFHFTYDVVRRNEEPNAPDYIENLIQLFKIHGSINWERTSQNKVQKKVSTKNPLLIYPRSTKFEFVFQQPYLEMISSFQLSLRKRNTILLVVGFGFNDTHIAEPILSAINTNLSLQVVVVSPNISEECKKNEYLIRINNLIELGDSRLALVEADFEEFVKAIPDVQALTELEKHKDRLKN